MKTMKTLLVILTIAVLLPVAAFAGKKEQPQPQNTPKQQDTTDWLNAPTPDGSPTLKETSDWLAQTIEAFGWGGNDSDDYTYQGVAIDNACTFHYTVVTTHYKVSGMKKKPVNVNKFDVSIPLGSVTDVYVDSDSDVVWRRAHAVMIKTGSLAVVRNGTTFLNVGELAIRRTPPVSPGGEMPEDPRYMVPRIISALQHAGSLCRSTYQGPVQKKQPF
jgi:hypothetical protein